MRTTIVARGLDDLGTFFRTAPEVAENAARMAINSVAGRSGMTAIRDAMFDEIAFPAGYLNTDRLAVTKRATNKNLEAVITGRKRATSLARFVTGSLGIGVKSNGITVRVKKGRTEVLRRGFLVRLRRGASVSEDNYNIGLAVRVGPGETVMGKKTTHQSWLIPGKVALLYGPSVDQVFRSVADEVAPRLGDMMEQEFLRQFARLSSGR